MGSDLKNGLKSKGDKCVSLDRVGNPLSSERGKRGCHRQRVVNQTDTDQNDTV